MYTVQIPGTLKETALNPIPHLIVLRLGAENLALERLASQETPGYLQSSGFGGVTSISLGPLGIRIESFGN